VSSSAAGGTWIASRTADRRPEGDRADRTDGRTARWYNATAGKRAVHTRAGTCDRQRTALHQPCREREYGRLGRASPWIQNPPRNRRRHSAGGRTPSAVSWRCSPPAGASQLARRRLRQRTVPDLCRAVQYVPLPRGRFRARRRTQSTCEPAQLHATGCGSASTGRRSLQLAQCARHAKLMPLAVERCADLLRAVSVQLTRRSTVQERSCSLRPLVSDPRALMSNRSP
jgi:hypothetical protein